MLSCAEMISLVTNKLLSQLKVWHETRLGEQPQKKAKSLID